MTAGKRMTAGERMVWSNAFNTALVKHHNDFAMATRAAGRAVVCLRAAGRLDLSASDREMVDDMLTGRAE